MLGKLIYPFFALYILCGITPAFAGQTHPRILQENNGREGETVNQEINNADTEEPVTEEEEANIPEEANLQEPERDVSSSESKPETLEDKPSINKYNFIFYFLYRYK